MKKNFYTDIIDETVIELNENFEDTVSRLMAQQGVCRSTDSQDMGLVFYCDKKGRISIFNSAHRSDVSYRIYSVVGKVVSENGKTKVKIQTLHDRSTVIYRIITAVSYLILITIYIAFLFFNNSPITIRELIPIPIFIFLFFNVFFHSNKETKNKAADIEIMKQEIINRVEAVKRWND